MAARKRVLRQKHLEMQAKFSPAYDYPGNLQVTGGNLFAPPGNLPEAFFVRVKLGFSNLGALYFN